MLLNTNVKNGPTAKMVIFINYNILNVHVVSINMISDNLFATHVWLKVASIKKNWDCLVGPLHEVKYIPGKRLITFFT